MLHVKRPLPIVAVGLIMVLTAVTAFAGGPASLDEAKALAAKEGKLVLIDFYAVWCGPCKAFNRDLESDKAIQARAHEFVLFKTDAEREGLELAKASGVVGYPTYVVMSADGTTLDSWYGYGKNMFLEKTGNTLSDPSTIEQKRARYEEKPTAGDALRLATFHDSRGDYKEAITLYEAAAELDEDSDNDHTMDIFLSTFWGFRDDLFTLDQLVARAENLFASDHAIEGDVIYAATVLTGASRRAENIDAAVPFLKKAVERTEASLDSGVQSMRADLLPDYAMIVLGDPEKAVAYKKASMKEGWMKDPNQLNGFAWWCFENRVNLEEAYKLSKTGADLAKAGPDRAMILDTVAEICNAMDDCRQALKYIREAIEEDPDRAYYKKQEKRFQELLAAQQEKS